MIYSYVRILNDPYMLDLSMHLGSFYSQLGGQ